MSWWFTFRKSLVTNKFYPTAMRTCLSAETACEILARAILIIHVMFLYDLSFILNYRCDFSKSKNSRSKSHMNSDMPIFIQVTWPRIGYASDLGPHIKRLRSDLRNIRFVQTAQYMFCLACGFYPTVQKYVVWVDGQFKIAHSVWLGMRVCAHTMRWVGTPSRVYPFLEWAL